MAQTVIQLTGLDGVLEMLQKLPSEVVSKRGGPIKSALRKGANVIAKQVRSNLQVVTQNATESGKRESTGLLLKNVVVTRGKPPLDGKGERYLVRIKRKTYPRRGGKAVTTLKSAQLLEYGSAKQPAEPYIRPAFQSKAEEAILLVESELVKSVDAIAQKFLTAGGA